MIKSNYCSRVDAENLADILCDENDKKNFMYGFMSAITFAHYKDLDEEDKKLYCGEIMERIVDSVGKDLMEEFLEEHFGVLKKE